jgi:site-specific recombinase XerD
VTFTLPATALAPVDTLAVQTAQADLARAQTYAAAEKAEATRAAYRTDVRIFAAWCASHGLTPLPSAPETVAAFLAHEADRGAKPATIARRLAAIRYAHLLANHEPPTTSEAVRAVLRGIRRTHGTAPAQKSAATSERIEKMLEHTGSGIIGVRDRALILLGFACALRRAEIVALTVADLADATGGLLVTIRRSKTDQEGQGQTVPLPHGHRLRPVEALQDWLAQAGITTGPVFRRITPGGRVLADALQPEAIAAIVKKLAQRAGFDPATFAGHSLRSGFVTSAVEDGASAVRVAEITRHRSLDTVAVYVRRLDAFRAHPGERFL